MITGIDDSDAALDFMKAAEPEMTKGNNDGIGYSAINSKNELFMEKWHQNKNFLNSEDILTEDRITELTPLAKKLSKYVNVGSLSKNYMSYGDITRNDLKTVTMHTRFATCGRSMENTHPFVDQGVSLIHNGVINNQYSLGLNKISTCDSEVALQLYINNNVVNGGKSTFQGFLDKLKGYWAFGILAKNADGNYILDVVREGASLYFTKIPELGVNSTIFATTKEIIETACKTCGFDKPEIHYLKEFQAGRFNAVTGKLLASVDLKKSDANEYKTKYTKSYWNHEDYYKQEDDAKVAFLNSKKDTKGAKVELITQGQDAYVSGELTEDEIALFELKGSTDSLVDSLQNYDDFMGSNYAQFFETMSPMMQETLEKKRETNKLSFKNVLTVIAEFDKFNYNKAWQLINKLAN